MSERDDRNSPNVYWVDDPSDANPPNADVVLSLTGVSRMFGIGRMRLLAFEALGLTRRRYRFGNLRVYGWADCERIALIIKSQRAGLRLRDLIPVIRAANSGVRASIRRSGLARCAVLIDRLENRRQRIDNALSELQHVCALLATESTERDPVSF